MATVIWFAGDFEPKYWAACKGQLLPINTNTALFSLLGTTYGGNGTTNFALPNFQSRAPIGYGNGRGLSPVTLGQVSGSESVTMNTNTMPNHVHVLTVQAAASNTAGTTDDPSAGILAGTPASNFAPASAITGNLGGVSIAIDPAGSSSPIDIRGPYLGLMCIICVYGIFPSRN